MQSRTDEVKVGTMESANVSKMSGKIEVPAVIVGDLGDGTPPFTLNLAEVAGGFEGLGVFIFECYRTRVRDARGAATVKAENGESRATTVAEYQGRILKRAAAIIADPAAGAATGPDVVLRLMRDATVARRILKRPAAAKADLAALKAAWTKAKAPFAPTLAAMAAAAGVEVPKV